MVVLGLAGVVLGGSAALAQSPESDEGARGTPRLKLSTEQWDFGRKWHGEPCSAEITITNEGSAPLKILKIRSSCGCTALKPARTQLLPGESDAMTLTYNTKKNKEQVSQTITLETNDPERPRVTIQVRGVVKRMYEVKPDDRITFIRVERDSVVTESVELHNNMDDPVELALQPFDEPQPFEVELEALEAGRSYKLSARTKPPLKLGANSTTVVLETGLDELPSLTIPVSAYIAPRVYVRPARLWVAPEVARSFQRFVRVSYRTEQPLEIKEVKSSHPDLIKVELLPPRKPANPKAVTRFHELRVTLPAGSDFPASGGRIEIYTDDPSPDYQKLVVEVALKKSEPRDLSAARQRVSEATPASEPEDTGETDPDEPD
jgi:hypothetical protein